MDSLIFIIFICTAFPLALAMALLDKKARLIVGFIIAGAFMCGFVSEINAMLRDASAGSMFYITTNITPLTEEIAKALPILFFAFLFSDDRETLLSISMATGIGFAIVENLFILMQSGASYTALWAIERVFGASLVHGLCTSLVGYGISFVRKRRKLFYTGSFALLVTAMVYHSIFNALVQSSVPLLGFLLPVITYIPIIYKRNKSNKKA